MSRNTFNCQRALQSRVVLFVRGFSFQFEQQRQENLVEGGEGKGGEGLENNAQEDIHRPGLYSRRSWRIQFKIKVSPVQGFLEERQVEEMTRKHKQ